MPKLHPYYEDIMNRHYATHLEMCNELGIDLKDIYTNELTDEDY